MQNPLISIVIPIYKVELYVERCINSVLKQTYRRLEVILVDDNTPDSSMEKAKACIAQSSLSKDIAFVYLKHDFNRGLSAARNSGINSASGDYVFFLDSDDEIIENCIALLVEPLQKKEYDIVMGYYRTNGNSDFPQQTVQGEILGVNIIAKEYYQDHWQCMAWNKLCNISFLKKNKLYFKEGLIHEDELWSALLACTAESMYAVNIPTYIYYIRDNSITTTEDINKRLYYYKKILQGFYEYQVLENLYSESTKWVENRIRSAVVYLMIFQHFSSYRIYSELRECDIHTNINRNNKYKSLKDKIINLDKFLPVIIGYIYRILIDNLLSYYSFLFVRRGQR